ncbi:unnamed protein product [Psylliodes chrysocephalus]|uniref:Amino acid transporter transmembrane domain-containing protein n=1 Tax=Psylliodes chrysocephalus TaxID=3402493 RepID=A0A9P0CEF8_9CUCU|nr:unnamed protein product [Psylliodes chrysocephala]
MTDEKMKNGTIEFSNSRYIQDGKGEDNNINKLTSHDDLNKLENNNKEDYKPHEHRILQHPNSYVGALIHIVKGSLGIGILSVPRAFKTAGLLMGTLGTIFVGILCTYTIHLLVRASHKICKRTRTPSLGFSETIEVVFRNGPKCIRGWASFAKIFVEVALSLTYYLSNAVYILLISESLTKLVSFYHPLDESWPLYFKLICLVILSFLCQIRELKHLVPFSLIANMTLAVTFGITLYYMIATLKETDTSDRSLFTGLESVPSFLSTVLFSIEGIGTIMPVENSMTEDKFLGPVGVLNVSMFLVVGLYTAMGFFGYLAFGSDTKAAITQNLPDEGIPAQVVQSCISIAMFFTFMLVFYVPTEILWKHIGPKIQPKYQNLAQVILRISTVAFVILVASVAGHNMDSLIDLTGAVFFSILGLLVPASTDLLVNWNDWGKWNYILWKNVLLFIAFVFSIVSGTTVAIQKIIR